MLFKSAIFTLGSLAVLSEASVINRPASANLIPRRGGNGGFNGGNFGPGNFGGNFGGNNNGAAAAAAANNGAGAGNGAANGAANGAPPASSATAVKAKASTGAAAGTVNNAAAANSGSSGSGSQCLSANAIQTGSASTGQANDVPSGGQSNSQTDSTNFINFCSGQTLTNGLQVKTGSCNGIVMGKIPATTSMVSSVITNPKLNDNLAAETTFNVTVNVANLQLGTFTNATSTYYSAPQDLSGSGQIIGHTHVTIQNVGSSFQFTQPLDATQFVFFKGINDAGNGQGTVTTAVNGGLPAGNYRVCTMSSSANHQPVLMPVAQRGAQDDCRYFTVGGSGSAASGNAGNAAGGNAGNTGNAGNAAGGNANAGSANNNAGAGAAASSAAPAASSAAAAGNNNAGNNNAGTGKKGSGGKGSNAAAASSVYSAPAAAATSPAAAAGAAASGSGAAASGSGAAASGALGGIAAPAVVDSGDSTRPFSVNGNSFVNKSAAIQRACAIQNNACSDAVNNGKASGFTVNDCNAQETTCNAQN